MTPSVYLWFIAAALTVKVKGTPPGWKVTAHLMRGDDRLATGLRFADATIDDQLVLYAAHQRERLAFLASPRDATPEGILELPFPDQTTLEGDVRFVDGPALEGLSGSAGRTPPFEGAEANAAFEALGFSPLKIENGHFSATVPSKQDGHVRIGCLLEKYTAAAHPTLSLTLPVGTLEARVEDERGKPIKTFTATSLGVTLGGKSGHFKHAVLADCDLQVTITAKGFLPIALPFRVSRGTTIKLPLIILRRKS